MIICIFFLFLFFFFNDTATTEFYTYLHTLSLHDALPIYHEGVVVEESGLGAPQYAREQVDEAHAAVDEGAIDHFFVIAARQPAHQHAASGQALDPQVVHPVLVVQDADRQRQHARDLRRPVRLEQVHHRGHRSEEQTSELQSLMRITYALF